MVMDDGLNTDCGRGVRLAGAGTADENDVLRVVKELAAMQGLHLGDADAAFGKIKPERSRCAGKRAIFIW